MISITFKISPDDISPDDVSDSVIELLRHKFNTKRQVSLMPPFEGLTLTLQWFTSIYAGIYGGKIYKIFEISKKGIYGGALLWSKFSPPPAV